MKQVTSLLASLAVVGLMLGAGPAVAQAPKPELAKPPPKDLVLRGDAKCTRCHNEEDDPQLVEIGKTRHGVNADQRTPTCTHCHGESASHIDKPSGAKERPKPDRIFKRNNETTSAEAQNGACLTCHQGGSRVHWQGSGHSRSQLACASCHSIHAARDQVLVKATQAGVCFTCHQDKRADIFRFSTHPLRTGWMSCSSCHAPHGSATEPNLVRNTVNETCYTCHADKRGPFLWEHPPVRENCGECHNPHGANNAAMLKVRGPYLCQQCHVAPQHPSSLYSGANLPPGYPGSIPPASPGDKMLGQQCANCHSKVHGSNHPSGARFTR
jgi:DmsE family decaheme c-type cytochrome